MVPVDVEPGRALDDNERYKVVWTVLNALRAHDDRFNAIINQIELNKERPDRINIIGVGAPGDPEDTTTGDGARDPQRALPQLKRVELQDVDFLPEALPMIIKCHRQLGRQDELRDYLERLSALRTGVSPMLALAELIAEQESLAAAKTYIVRELKIRPTIRGIDRLIDYALDRADGGAREDLTILKETALRLIAGKATHKCGSCGFAGRSLHWQCPGCKSWSTVKPIHGIEGE